MPIDPDMMKAVEAEEERRKLTNPEVVERLAKVHEQSKRLPGRGKNTAATLRALSAALEQARAVKVRKLEWKPACGFYSEKHQRAVTQHGEYLIGPRKSDGCWEYCTPDGSWGEHNGHMLDDLTEEQAFAAVERHYEDMLSAMLDMGDG